MIKCTLHNDCLVCSIVCKMYIMGWLLWVWNYRAKSLFIHSFFLSFIYFFVSLFAHAIVRAYLVRVFKEKTSHAGPVEEWVDARQNGLTYFFLLQRSCSNCVDAYDAHAGLELCWSYVFLDALTDFMWVFFYCKDSKTLIRLRRGAHACICWSRTLLVSCFLGITYFI